MVFACNPCSAGRRTYAIPGFRGNTDNRDFCLRTAVDQATRVRSAQVLWHHQLTAPADQFDDVLGRLHCAFLPARQLRHLTADHVEASFGLQQTPVSLCVIITVGVPVGPTTTFTWNVLPRNRDRLVRWNQLSIGKLGMKLYRTLAGHLDPVLETHVAKSNRIL